MTVTSGAAARRLGYNWERSLSARIRGLEGWDAQRIGAPSPHLPDVLAWHREPRYGGTEGPRVAAVFECKATSRRKLLSVPREQVSTLAAWAHGPLRAHLQVHEILAFRWTPAKQPRELFVFLPDPAFVNDGGVTVSMDGTVAGVADAEGTEPKAVGWGHVANALEAWK